MSISIELTELSALMLEIDDAPGVQGGLQTGISVSPAPAPFFDAAIRLLASMEDPTDRKVLCPLYIREILYRVRYGPQGAFLRAIALRQGPRHRIAHVLNLIHANFEGSMDVPALAETAGMSVSTFHHNFKDVTTLAPLQYVKTIRLHRARSLLLYEGLSASEAAFQVGYGSASQFSREFRRLFGLPPAEEVARMKATEGLLEAEEAPFFLR
jgi:AraC-like DNA-binding protein